MAETYRIVRFYADRGPMKIKGRRGLTLEEAQAHCRDPETSSKTATGPLARERTRLHGSWFDGYEKE